MWVQLICGLVVYRVVKRYFYDDDDDVLDDESSNFNSLFSVALRLEKLYGGKVYVGLQIPDADSGSRQSIDIVLVTEREAVVICVKNVSGFVAVDKDGSWLCKGGHKHKTQHLLDPVAEAKQLVPILESYLEQRGVALPEGYFTSKVICPNPNFSAINTASFPPEVITYDQWIRLKPEHKNTLSGWIKGAFRGGKKEMQESIHEKLNFVLNTAPTSDRLELKGDKSLLGEFLEFKGSREDIQAMRNIRRSKVSRLEIQKMSMFGLDKENKILRSKEFCWPGCSRIPCDIFMANHSCTLAKILKKALFLFEIQLIQRSKFYTALEIIMVKEHQLLNGRKSLFDPAQK